MIMTSRPNYPTTQPWADHPSAPRRRRRKSVAQCLGLSSGEATASAERLARVQRSRGVKTIDTAALSGTLGGTP